MDRPINLTIITNKWVTKLSNYLLTTQYNMSSILSLIGTLISYLVYYSCCSESETIKGDRGRERPGTADKLPRRPLGSD